MILSISEILIKADKLAASDTRAAVDYLRANNSVLLQTMFRGAYDPAVVWTLPEGKPPYKPLESDYDQQGMLYQECRRLYLFIEGGPIKDKTKRERLFIELLEAIDPADAVLLCAIKDKQLPDTMKHLTSDLVLQAFPGLW